MHAPSRPRVRVTAALPLLARLPIIVALIVFFEVGAVHRPSRWVGEDAVLIDTALDSCRVHTVHSDFPLRERTFPCGEVITIPAGRYHFWLEMDDLITPFPSLAFSSGKLSTITVVTPVDRAGFVTFDPPSLPDDEDELHGRLFSVTTPNTGQFLQRAFRRIVPPGRTSPSRMPEGIVFGGLFRRDGDAVALSRPVDVVGKKTATVAPRRPKNAADVFVELRPGKLIEEEDLDSFAIHLSSDFEEPRPPDVVVTRADGIRAVWYGLTLRRATLACNLKTRYLPPQELRLTPGNVTTYRGQLKNKPGIDVQVNAPADAFDGAEITMSVRSRDGRTLYEARVERNSSTRIDGLPAEKLSVMVSAGRWRVGRRADLSDGEDAMVVFEIAPIVLTGTVTKGDDRVPDAALEWQVDREDPLVVETDAGGRYRVTLWRTGLVPLLIRTAPDSDQSIPPFFETVQVAESMERDFHLPDTRLTVRVEDAQSGKPIAGATIGIGNRWDGEKGSLSDTALRAITDDEGVAHSPPLREGTLSIYVTAAGYRDAEPIERPTPPEGEASEVVVRMEPEGEVATHTVLLPDRRPASGAEAWVFDEARRDPLWRGTASSDGSLVIPKRLAGSLLIVRHPDAASSIETVRGDSSEILLRPAAPPLRVRCTDDLGEPVPWRMIALLYQGKRLLGGELAMLTWSRGAADRFGVWEARGLPEEPVRVIAFEGEDHANATAGGYDAFAVEIPFPWPDDVSVEVVK